MGFWIFMLIMDLLIPGIMIGFGSYFAENAPENINLLFGYRTPRSMKNRNTWEFAHHYFGKLWRVTGWILFPVSIAVMLLCLGKDIFLLEHTAPPYAESRPSSFSFPFSLPNTH